MSALNTISKNDIVRVRDWLHNAIEGCDGEFLDIVRTIETLIAGYKDLRDFKLQESQSAGAIDEQVEIVPSNGSNYIYCSECPFKMGYDYWVDMGVAAHVWNTVIASPDELIRCVAHHLKHRESAGVLEDKFWSWMIEHNKGVDCSLFIHIEGKTRRDVEEQLTRIWANANIESEKLCSTTSSFTDRHAWHLTYIE